jgi:Putative prokaryotic signal transducing protein
MTHDPTNLDDEPLARLTTVPGEFEAGAIVSALEAEGIRATFVGGFTAGFRAEAPGGVSVMVLEDDLPRAKEVLADLRQHGAGIDWSKVDTEHPADGDPAAGSP